MSGTAARMLRPGLNMGTLNRLSVGAVTLGLSAGCAASRPSP
jgi:hypothetical protein